MRRTVWVVLGLVGMAPVGALAQQNAGQAGAAPATSAPTDASQADIQQIIIVELPATGTPPASNTASAASRQVQVTRPRARPSQGTGGSGVNQGPAAQQGASASNIEVFQGTLRALEPDRMRMVDASHRVYEFGVGQQTRIIGPDGSALSRQALREGMPVRTVTQPGGVENEVVTLQVFGPTPAPSQ